MPPPTLKSEIFIFFLTTDSSDRGEFSMVCPPGEMSGGPPPSLGEDPSLSEHAQNRHTKHQQYCATITQFYNRTNAQT